jgi:PAS domain S-box-containing protein
LIFFLFFLFSPLFSPFLICAGADAKPFQSITIVSDNNYPPYIFRSPEGNLQGILVDEWKLWEKKTGIKATLIGMDWGKAQNFMRRGKADVIDTIFFTKERAKLYDFTKPYAKLDVPIFFHKNISGIIEISSLRGYRIGVKAGDACIDFLKEKGITDLEEYPSYEAIIMAAATGRLKVFSIDEPPALYYLYKLNLENEFRRAFKLYTGEFHRAVKKGRTELLNTVENGFRQITKAEHEAIEKRWLGETLLTTKYFRYFFFVFLSVLAIFLILLFFSFMLRRRIKLRTVELEQSFENLKKSEEKYRELVETANSVILRFDRRGKITFFNSYAEQFFGYTEQEILGKNVLGTIVPENETTGRDLKQMMADIVRHPQLYVNNINENMRKNGERVWLNWRNKPVYDQNGRLTQLLSVGIDITEQKIAEEARRESEERFRALSESSPDIIYTMDSTGAITYVNSTWKLILGHEKEEVLGHYFTDFAKEEDHKTYRKWFKGIRDEGKTVNDFGILLTKDGKERIFNMHSTFMNDSNGRVISIFGSLRDLTEYKEMEEKLNHAQRLESIGTLAGGIAHDFNNLLMGIQGYVSLMMLKTEKSHPNFERMKRIEEQISRGSDLTKQLLGFAQKGRYEQKPAQINEVIVKTSSLFGRTKKEISIDLNLDEHLYPVEVDEGQMEQMLMNLYVNAWQAMPVGGNLYLETANVFLEEERARANDIEPGSYIRISIKDTGVGMDKKTVAQIFDPFFTTKKMGGGTGLGLAMVYGIVKGHKGMIEVTSEPGQGTTFDIYLPATEKDIKKNYIETTTQTHGGSETILLVDDEKAVLETTGELISSLGYRLYTAGSGQEAIAVYKEKEGEIDMIILDMIMPGLSGGTTFNLLREINPQVRVLLCSGYSIDGQAKEILNQGCKGFLQKPFKFEELSRKIRESLET